MWGALTWAWRPGAPDGNRDPKVVPKVPYIYDGLRSPIISNRELQKYLGEPAPLILQSLSVFLIEKGKKVQPEGFQGTPRNEELLTQLSQSVIVAKKYSETSNPGPVCNRYLGQNAGTFLVR